MTLKYNPFRTAIKRGGALSKPMSTLLNKKLLNGKILDFGCGYGEDVKILSSPPYSLNIKGYDRYSTEYIESYHLLSDTYDVITCNYMFNVIPDLETHRFTLDILRSKCKIAYIAVRTDTKAIKDNWKWDSEAQGYWTSTGTFQRFYDDYGLVEELFGEVEYIVDNNSMKLFKIKGSVNDEKISINNNDDCNNDNGS